MEALGHDYRCYALDFWGFGESGKKRESYAVADFMDLVKQFMDALGIARSPLPACIQGRRKRTCCGTH